MLRLNLRFRAAVKFHSRPIPILAALAGVNPNALFDLIHERSRPVENDPTILPVAELLGFKPDDCFIGGRDND